MSIALYHFHVTQIKRSAGQSAIASAAYRSGEKLHSEYYGEDSDYTKKGGVICSEILLPPHAPPSFSDRETLWNEVEKAERGKKAQLAYSFDIALQNEFSMQENIELARQFLLEQFVGRGMVVDFAVHSPDKEDGGISNPHFHVMCPIRPLDEHGRWGNKQRREYLLDEHGERIRDEAGNYVFNAVSTTDWGSPDTLEHWRQAWADLCNQKFAEKELDCRIDHRSYERQGIDQLPTVHEGLTVRAMEAKGIRTNKVAQEARNHTSNHTDRQLRNPFAGVLMCEKCGSIMKRYIPDAKKNPTPWYRCTKRGCDCKMIKCETVEQAVRDSMEDWLEEYIIHINSNQKPAVDPVETALQSVRTQLAQLQLQQESICEYLEKGIYTVEVFTKRNEVLSKEIRRLQNLEADLLRQQKEGNQQKKIASRLIPTAQHILDNYSQLSVEEKNQLWKLVMKKVTVYRSQDDKLTVNIYPNLPK